MKMPHAIQVVATIIAFPIYFVARVISAAVYKSKAQFGIQPQQKGDK